MNQRGQPPPTFVLSCIRLQFDEGPGFLHPSNPEMFYSQPSQSILKISITSQFSWPSLTVSAIECLSKFRPVNLWTLFLEPPLMVVRSLQLCGYLGSIIKDVELTNAFSSSLCITNSKLKSPRGPTEYTTHPRWLGSAALRLAAIFLILWGSQTHFGPSPFPFALILI